MVISNIIYIGVVMKVGDYVLVAILAVLVVALFVVSYVRKKKYNGELSKMREDLKIGDRVMTDTGVVGEVVDSYVEDEYKYFVLKSGRGANVGYFAVHANAIYYVFDKEEQEKPKKQNYNAKPKEAKQTEQTSEQIETKEGETN